MSDNCIKHQDETVYGKHGQRGCMDCIYTHELIQKREAEAELTGFNYAINKCTSLIGKESYGEEANQAIRFLAQAWALDLPMVSSQLKNDTLNLPDGQIPVVKPNVKTDVPKVMAILKNEGKVKDE